MNLLLRISLRKAALDAGFDVLDDAGRWIEAASSHAPLRALLTSEAGGLWVGLSMPSVAQALDMAPAPAPADAPRPMPAWLTVPDMQQLDALLGRAWALSRSLPDALEKRFEARLAGLSGTEREATVRQRVGQDLFREGLMTLWGGRCAVTGLAVPALLRASHAKPWADSSDAERLDVYNGLLLAAHLDAAFDAGLMTLDKQGQVVLSACLDAKAVQTLGVAAGTPVHLQDRHRPYMDWHRQKVFMTVAAAPGNPA